MRLLDSANPDVPSCPSRSALQTMLDTCQRYGYDWCLSYNPRKSKAMLFGKPCSSKALNMYDQDFEFVTSYKYLGVDIVSGRKISFSAIKPLIRFRSSVNTILNCKSRLSEQVLMKLL